MTQLEVIKKDFAMFLKVAQDLATTKLAEGEEKHQRASRQHSTKRDSLRSELSELQLSSSRFLQKLKETKKQRAALTESLHQLQIATTLELERQQNCYKQELADNLDQLLRRYDIHM